MNIVHDIRFIVPEIILLTSALLVLMLGLFVRRKEVLGGLSLVGIVAAAISLASSYSLGRTLMFGMLVNDTFSLFFKYLCLLAVGLVILISMGYRRLAAEDKPEYYFLLLVMAIAMMLAVSTHNLLMIYIGIEMVSLISYILVAYEKDSLFSSEGALKYFLFGSLTTAFMVYGISFVYGIFGTLDLSAITGTLHAKQNEFIVFVPLLLILAGLSFKCALVPFHMWVPDAYQGAPTPITALLSVGPKAVGFAVLMRIFLRDVFISSDHWIGLVTLISIFTMTVGNVIAISQTNIKRLLAYSSIAQAGYMLIGFVSGGASGILGVSMYLLTYVVMNLGAFGCVVLISNSIHSDDIKDYAGLYRRNPLASLLLTVFLLSLAGIPPLAGFVAKFFVFAAAIEAKQTVLAIAGVINSVIAVYYYLKVIRYMYLHEPQTLGIERTPLGLQAALAVVGVGVFAIGILPFPFLAWIKTVGF